MEWIAPRFAHRVVQIVLTVFVMAFATTAQADLATYIVLFGDVLQARALLDEADESRPDEKVIYEPSRAHAIFGGRNAVMSIIGPDVAMCGPLWAAMHVVIVERYKDGKAAMHSIFGGSGSFRWGTNTGLLLMPVVTLVQPILGVALALTLLIQGYVSVRIGIMEARSQRDLGIAGVTGAVLATQGATWAFAVGIALCLLVYGRDFFSGEDDGTFAETEAVPQDATPPRGSDSEPEDSEAPDERNTR